MTPNINGDLHIVIDVESELNDQIYFSDTMYIQCLSNINEINSRESVISSFDLNGRKINTVKNKN